MTEHQTPSDRNPGSTSDSSGVPDLSQIPLSSETIAFLEQANAVELESFLHGQGVSVADGIRLLSTSALTFADTEIGCAVVSASSAALLLERLQMQRLPEEDDSVALLRADLLYAQARIAVSQGDLRTRKHLFWTPVGSGWLVGMICLPRAVHWG